MIEALRKRIITLSSFPENAVQTYSIPDSLDQSIGVFSYGENPGNPEYEVFQGRYQIQCRAGKYDSGPAKETAYALACALRSSLETGMDELDGKKVFITLERPGVRFLKYDGASRPVYFFQIALEGQE